MGFIFFEGLDVPKDFVEAYKWYRLAAEGGNSDAQFTLGLMNLRGYGVEKDYEAAIEWFRVAAENGNVSGMNNLGLMLKSFSYGQVDKPQAYAWLAMAESLGHQRAGKTKIALVREMSKEELQNGEHLFIKYRERFGH